MTITLSGGACHTPFSLFLHSFLLLSFCVHCLFFATLFLLFCLFFIPSVIFYSVRCVFFLFSSIVVFFSSRSCSSLLIFFCFLDYYFFRVFFFSCRVFCDCFRCLMQGLPAACTSRGGVHVPRALRGTGGRRPAVLLGPSGVAAGRGGHESQEAEIGCSGTTRGHEKTKKTKLHSPPHVRANSV